MDSPDFWLSNEYIFIFSKNHVTCLHNGYCIWILLISGFNLSIYSCFWGHMTCLHKRPKITKIFFPKKESHMTWLYKPSKFPYLVIWSDQISFFGKVTWFDYVITPTSNYIPFGPPYINQSFQRVTWPNYVTNYFSFLANHLMWLCNQFPFLEKSHDPIT